MYDQGWIYEIKGKNKRTTVNLGEPQQHKEK